MKFTTIREDKNHRVHVTNRSEELFIEKIQKDTATGLMKGYRHFLSYSSGIGSYLRMSEIPSLCMSCELRRSNEGQPEFGRWNGLVTLEVHELGTDGNGEWMTAVTLITELKRLAGAALKDIPTTRSFGRILTNIPGLQFKNSKNGRVYLVRPVNRK
jgi:hypothetical protein